MARLKFLRDATITLPEKTIIEPLNAPRSVHSRLNQFFPENLYTHSSQGTLFKFLTALVGDAGVGGYKKNMLYPRLANSISNTHFHDLDKFFGNPLKLPRTKEETYEFDPITETLTLDQWSEVRRKDAWYRARCIEYMKAIQLGNSPEGMRRLAQAASGVNCDIFERWKFLDDQISDEPIGMANIGFTGSRNEFTVIPLASSLRPEDERRVSNAIHRLKPANAIFSIRPELEPRINVPIAEIETTSTYFQAQRIVTGNKNVQYPPVDLKTGLWIEPGQAKEAPLVAFASRSEYTTWPTIVSANSSSSHVGPFNKLQQRLFPHLRNIPDTVVRFDPNEAFLNYPVSLDVSTPWIGRNENIFINNYFPIGYLADPNVPSAVNYANFWASAEREPVENPSTEDTEWIVFDFGTERFVNYVQFEASTKPYSIVLEWLDETLGWIQVNLIENYAFENKKRILFTASSYSWENVQFAFEKVQTRRLRLSFKKDVNNKFPYPNSPIFPWSVEIKNFRAAEIVSTLADITGTSDVVNPDVIKGDEGLDILGNAYYTQIDVSKFAPAKMIDNELDTFWQSQANPSRFAVECIYLDIRDDDGNPQLVDEIYIDPITHGSLMHIYWTNEDPPETVPDASTTPLDYRLWNPIPRHYILGKGYHSLKRSIRAKYLKLEFTKLQPVPYEVQDTNFNSITYRTYPSWVFTYVTDLIDKRQDDSPFRFVDDNRVKINDTNLGLLRPENLKVTEEAPESIEDFIIEDEVKNNLSVYQTWKGEEIVTDSVVTNNVINVYPNDLFQNDLATTLNLGLFLNGVLFNQGLDGIFITESTLVDKPLIDYASRNDRTLVEEEKTFPDLWFPRVVRHGYKILEAERNYNMAFIVAIREIRLSRFDAESPRDLPFYHETLSDSFNIAKNTFEQVDWRLVVPTTFLGETQTQSDFSNLGDENFDVLTSDA